MENTFTGTSNASKTNEDASKIIPLMIAFSISELLKAYGFKEPRQAFTSINDLGDTGSIVLELEGLQVEVTWKPATLTVKTSMLDSPDDSLNQKTWTIQDVKNDGFDFVVYTVVVFLNDAISGLGDTISKIDYSHLAVDAPVRGKLEALVKDDHEAFDYLDYDFYDWYAKDFLPSLDYHRDWSDDYDCFTTDDETAVKTVTVYGSGEGNVEEIIFTVDDDEWFDAIVYSLHDLDTSLAWSMIPSSFILKHSALKPFVMDDAYRLSVYETGVYDNDGMVAVEAEAHSDPYYGVDVDSLPGGADYD